jgi:UDP-glucose 4-epimerase
VPRVVLLTGVSRYPGNRLAARLAADPAIERVIGIDSVSPSDRELADLGRTEFVPADIRNPLIAKVIRQAKVDTVVHAAVTAMPGGVGGRTSMKELNVIGTMQLLAACQNSERVARLVVKSSTAVYGASPRDPAMFDESMPAKAVPRSGYAKDCAEVEAYVRGFSRRRPDVTVTVFRFANFIGPTVDTSLTRYLALPVVPTAFGFDPRLQLLHTDDATEVLRLASVTDRPGVFNAAGEGVILLSQAIRRSGRLQLPVPLPAVGLVAGLVRRNSSVDFTADQLRLLNYGRVVDVSALQHRFGYVPAYTTESAYASFLAGRGGTEQTSPELLEQLERTVGRLVSLSPRNSGSSQEQARHG